MIASFFGGGEVVCIFGKHGVRSYSPSALRVGSFEGERNIAAT